jgi:uncharacterized protein (TIGR02284 family)
MTDNDVIKNVVQLIQVDIDALAAYKQALSAIDDSAIHKKMKSFADDHARHIKELSKWVKDAGGTPPENTKDIKGFLIQGFTAIAGKIGLKSVLTAMQQNEKLTNKAYKNAKGWKGSSELKELVSNGYDDEVKHMEFLDEQLKALKK